MKKIAFVSVLKPADDIRLFGKIAQIYLEKGFEIHSIGFYTSDSMANACVFLYPIFRFSRLSLPRLLAGWKCLYYLLKIKPQTLVCGCIELLPFCVLYKIICLRKLTLYYDIQENYVLNIRYTQVFGRWLRIPLSLLARTTEWLCSIFVNVFFLAEKCYAHQLPFLGSRFITLENKALQMPAKNSDITLSPILRLSFVGTLAPEYGLWKAIELSQKLHAHNRLKLSIIGRCTQKSVLENLSTLKKEFLEIHMSHSPIAHARLLTAMQLSDIILMPYQINVAYRERIPTKFYEAMALKKIIILQENPHWRDFFQAYGYKHVIWTDFWEADTDIALLATQIAYFKNTINTYENENIYWETEKQKLGKL